MQWGLKEKVAKDIPYMGSMLLSEPIQIVFLRLLLIYLYSLVYKHGYYGNSM